MSLSWGIVTPHLHSRLQMKPSFCSSSSCLGSGEKKIEIQLNYGILNIGIFSLCILTSIFQTLKYLSFFLSTIKIKKTIMRFDCRCLKTNTVHKLLLFMCLPHVTIKCMFTVKQFINRLNQFYKHISVVQFPLVSRLIPHI